MGTIDQPRKPEARDLGLCAGKKKPGLSEAGLPGDLASQAISLTLGCSRGLMGWALQAATGKNLQIDFRLNDI
jgi:hypothetical protein